MIFCFHGGVVEIRYDSFSLDFVGVVMDLDLVEIRLVGLFSPVLVLVGRGSVGQV